MTYHRHHPSLVSDLQIMKGSHHRRRLSNHCVCLLSLTITTTPLATAFAPVASTSTSTHSTPAPRQYRSSSRLTASYVSVTSVPQLPSPHSSRSRGNKGVFKRIITRVSTPSSVARSAVIQSYRVENDNNQHQRSTSTDAFSLLPSRLTSIKRVEDPSQFQSQVLDEKDALVVVRFYADACPSCKATSPLFRRWSREITSTNNIGESAGSAEENELRNSLSIKVLEMPLNKATSSYLQDQLHVDQLPYVHLYHPKFGLVEEQLVMNKREFCDFVTLVDGWSKGGGCEVVCSGLETDSPHEGDCQEFC
ncbi:predicted protein [Thalassiosira pseudonana CCMP1335]|jgi:thiol-disulfide isomerase/thioredoxin|uniref:Thioredoxin domain-containing protein n=1 Tax=Thalassiosira pseudonana TaxID=35128 RepID=B5YME5_THAPS|nr:predicted protein [Thalassiosira pseudonana CCMP1335]ACI64445.1 predicted protein [Thalassiosira pseudonana CCMP1335]